MRIDRDGNVGIGTTDPATKLDVNGDITIQSIKGATSLATDANVKIIVGTAAANQNLGYTQTPTPLER